MPNFDAGHYLLTVFAPLRSDPVQQGDRFISRRNALKEVLARMPSGERSAASYGTGVQAPFARNRRTHFARFVVLDYVVSNAAVNPLMKWDETSLEDFNLLFETNVRGAWVVCTEGAKQMIREGHGGAICCVSSISAHVGAPGQTAYCGTKGAISMLAKALACDLGEHGIRVNAVEPGWTITPMSAPLLDDPVVLKYYQERIPLHRGAQPEELAAAITFLLSADASYVTAATLLVDGGFIVNAEL